MDNKFHTGSSSHSKTGHREEGYKAWGDWNSEANEIGRIVKGKWLFAMKMNFKISFLFPLSLTIYFYFRTFNSTYVSFDTFYNFGDKFKKKLNFICKFFIWTHNTVRAIVGKSENCVKIQIWCEHQMDEISKSLSGLFNSMSFIEW